MGWGARLIGLGQVTDALRNIQTRISGNTVYVVGTNVEYSVYVELGTSRMDAQPYLAPAVRKAQRNLQQIAGDAQSEEEAIKRIALFIEREAAKAAPVDTGNLQASIKSVKVQ